VLDILLSMRLTAARTTPALAELDGLLVELGELRARLQGPAAHLDEDALWELEVAFRHLGARATARADLLQREIELVNEQRRSA
jgi:hypothetical protein